MKNSSDGGEAILEAFRRLNIDHIISSPGSEWAPIWEGLARQKSGNKPGPNYIDCWHETLAVNMATGYTQMTGRMQAVLLHAGAGLLQGSIGIHGATLNEVPMLLLSGESLSYGEDPEFDPGAQWYRSLSIVGGPNRLVEPIVKWGTHAPSIHALHESVIRAGEMAQRSPMGPTYLNVPVETMVQEWSPPDSVRAIPCAPRVQPQPRDIDEIVGLLLRAKNPAIVTATAGRDPAAFMALVELAELLAIPVVEGNACGYANFPKDHPLHLGSSVAAFKEADLVLAVSSRVPWYPPSSRPRNATIVAIDGNPLKGNMAYQNLQADRYLEGDVALTLRLLIDAVKASGARPDRKERFAHWQGEHEKLRTAQRAAEAKAASQRPIDPLWLCAALRSTMPADAIYVDETVMHSGMFIERLPWQSPQSFFHIYGGLGQGLGRALGIKLAAKERPVVMLIGDGSFLYNPVMAAFGAARDYELPLLIIVCNNGKYQAMKKNHLDYYPDGVAASAEIFHGVHINGPDYAELGKPFGYHGERVEDPAMLEAALTRGLAAVKDGRTAILNVVLNR